MYIKLKKEQKKNEKKNSDADKFFAGSTICCYQFCYTTTD